MASFLSLYSVVLSSLAVVSGTGTAVSVAGVLTVPLSVPLSIISVLTGSFSIVVRAVCIKLNIKHKKHDRIAILAKSKKNSIDIILSKALTDNIITGDDFELVVNEMERYEELKNEIRIKSQKPS